MKDELISLSFVLPVLNLRDRMDNLQKLYFDFNEVVLEGMPSLPLAEEKVIK